MAASIRFSIVSDSPTIASYQDAFHGWKECWMQGIGERRDEQNGQADWFVLGLLAELQYLRDLLLRDLCTLLACFGEPNCNCLLAARYLAPLSTLA
jgi:hypothetical protein